ncbi:MAG: DNA gyrase inhibitor YacG [Paracoccaceae bacterium]
MDCPICQKPTTTQYRPFCCKRCADLDLGKWLTGAYAVASDDDDDIGALETELNEQAKKPH